MPKMKTNRGAAKRFKITAGGKIKSKKANSNHILTKKTRKRKRNLRAGGQVDKTNERGVRRLLPYIGK
jgi:large subunit ribosomal protein L35